MLIKYIRLIYGLICSALTIFALFFQNSVILTDSKLDLLSYYGVTFTIVGVIITIAEIVRSAAISSTIEQKTRQILVQTQQVNKTSNISDCLSCIDDANKRIADH